MKDNLLKKIFNFIKPKKINIEKRNISEISIDDNIYKLDKKAYNYAIEMTNKELNQAVEGLFHNLNTLQLRKAA